MVLSINQNDICSRTYSKFTVIYDLKGKQILKLEDVSADIWNYIYQNKEVENSALLRYLTENYDCNEDEIQEDVQEFIYSLYESGVLLIDGSYYEVAVGDDEVSIAIETDDYEGEIISELEPENQLYSATFEMTYSCNEKCVHCYAGYPEGTTEHQKVTLEEYKGAIDQLLDKGCMHLSFTGGDPFMNPDFLELFMYSRSKGFVCDVFTNALYLYDHPGIMERIVSVRPRAFYISLYGSNAEIHDSVTQMPGSFNKTIAAADLLVKAGVSVVFNIMVLSVNYQDVPDIIKCAKSHGAEYRVSMSIIYKNDGDSNPMNYFIGDKDKIKYVLNAVDENLYTMDKSITALPKNEYICGAGATSICIAPDGIAYPCVSLKIPFGNIKKDSIQQIWDSAAREQLVTTLKWENTKQCKNCENQDVCPHCVGISRAETSDMFSCNTCDRMIAECMK